MIAPQINSLVVAQQYDYAVRQMENNKISYGPKNELLYLLDYGMVLHLAGRYPESIRQLEKAKKLYDQLYTVSLTNKAGTWLMNDNTAPYRGEDFERVMINVVQALNFAVIGDFEEALVEARNVDVQLKVINRQYKDDEKNVYQNDAFARFIMGLLYEAEGSFEGINDAYISYASAADIYEHDYSEQYGVIPPELLKENILAAAEVMGKEEFSRYRQKFPDVNFVSVKEKQTKAEVYVIHYQGLSPVKYPIAIPIPLPGGFATKLAFPAYHKRTYEPKSGEVKAVNLNGRGVSAMTEQGTDIGAIAIQSLDNRKARVIAKAVLRAGGKHVVAKALESRIEEGANDGASRAFRHISNLYNIISEQPDLRSWQTLPAEIRVARLILEPGEHEVFFNDTSLGKVVLTGGSKKFLIVRTNL